MVQRLQIPAPVHREPTNRIPTRSDQPPQRLRRIRTPREPAPHPHDHNRIVTTTTDGGRHRTHRLHRTTQLTQQERRQPLHTRIVERQRRRKHQTSRTLQPVPQLHRRQRIKTQLPERTPRRHRLTRHMPQHHRHLRPHDIADEPLPFPGGQAGQPLAERGEHRLGDGGRPGLGEFVEERTRTRGSEERQEVVPADVGDRQRALVATHRVGQRGHRPPRVHRHEALAPQQLGLALVGGHADPRPGSPGDGRAGQAGRAPTGDQPVQSRIRRPVHRLPATAPHPRDRREHHKRVHITDQSVQMQRPVHLPGQHTPHMRLIRLHQRSILTHTRRMHDRINPADNRQQSLNRRPVSQITRMHLRTGQLLQQPRSTLRTQTTPRHQHHTPGTLSRSPPRNLRTQTTRTTSHQHRPPRTPPSTHTPRRHTPRRHPLQTPHQHPTTTHRDLVLHPQTTRKHHTHPSRHPSIHHHRQIQQTTPQPRMLQTHHPPETPQRSLTHIHRTIRPTRRHRRTRHQPQRGSALDIDQGLDQLQGLGDGGRGGEYAGEVRGKRRRVGQRDDGRAQSGQCRGQAVAVVPDPGPGAGECGRGRFGRRVPGDAVAPAVDQGPLPATGPPGGQGREYVGDGPGVDAEFRGERGEVGAVDRVPEVGVGGVGGRAGACGGALQPVTLPLEGVGGEVHDAGVGVEGGPVHRCAVGVQGGQGRDGGGGFVVVAAQERYADRFGGRLAREGGEGRVRSEFHVRGDAVQRVERVGEPDGAEDVVGPVRGVGPLAGLDRAAGDRGDDGQFRLAEGEEAQQAAELGEHRFHEPGVEGVAGAQPGGLPASFGRLRRGLGDGAVGTRDDDGVRPVDGGDVEVGEGVADVGLGGLDGEHRAAGGQFLHQPAAGGDQGGGVGEGEDPGGVGGGDLADGVADQDVGGDAPVAEEGEGGDLHGEDGGLRVLGTAEEFLVGEGVGQGAFELAVEVPGGLVEGGGEGRLGGVQYAAHGEALGALAGEEEGGAAPGRRPGRGDGVCGGGAGGEGGEGPCDLLAVGAEGDGPVGEVGAGRGEGEGQVGEVGVGSVEAGEEVRGLSGEGFGGTGGQGQCDDTGGRGAGAGGLFGGRRCFEDQVGVGAAHAERGDGRAAGPVGLGPGLRLGEQPYGTRGPVDVRGRLVHVEGPGQAAVPQCLDHLDDAADPGRGLGVSDVGLEGADPERGAGAVLAVGGQEGLGLDGVAEGGAGAVGLDGVDVRRVQAGVGEGLADDALLGGAVGGGETVGGAVLVDGGAADDGEDAVAGGLGGGEPFDQQHADALGPRGAVGRRRERLAAAVGGEAALPGEGDEGGGAGHHGDAAGQGHRALALAQRLRGEVEGDQGGGAGRVDSEGGALEAEGVGDPAGGDARGVAGDEVALQGVGGVLEAGPVLLGLGADEDADALVAEGVGRDAGAFQCFPGGFQDEALLGVHGEGFARVDAEEVGVELGGVVEEAAVAGVAGARCVGVGGVEGVEVPAAVGGERADGVGAGLDELPQRLGGVDAAGEAAGHADDGDGLVGVTGGRAGVGRFRGEAEEFGVEVAGERGRRGMVEGQRHGECEAGRGGQPAVQFDRGQRVEAVLEERAVGRDRFAGGAAQRGGGQFGHQVGERLLCVRCRQAGQAAPQLRSGVLRGPRRRFGSCRSVTARHRCSELPGRIHHLAPTFGE